VSLGLRSPESLMIIDQYKLGPESTNGLLRFCGETIEYYTRQPRYNRPRDLGTNDRLLLFSGKQSLFFSYRVESLILAGKLAEQSVKTELESRNSTT